MYIQSDPDLPGSSGEAIFPGKSGCPVELIVGSDTSKQSVRCLRYQPKGMWAGKHISHSFQGKKRKFLGIFDFFKHFKSITRHLLAALLGSYIDIC
eukprot:sb/3479176/